MNVRYELQNLISRTGGNSKENLIAAAAHYLAKSKRAGRELEKNEFTKDQEATRLIEWINKNKLWHEKIDQSRFIAQGAEQRVYLTADGNFVLKLNDAIFYEYWFDYFVNLLIHNKLFSQTSYELVGFVNEASILYAVVKQSHIKIDQPTDPDAVKSFLIANGFQHKKNNDYFHLEMSIILEDLHDENVLTYQGVLFFIDTIFYLTTPLTLDFS